MSPASSSLLRVLCYPHHLQMQELTPRPLIPKTSIKDLTKVGLALSVNGTTKQSGTTADMIFPVPSLIAFVSSIMRLEAGDVILTGTPKGVGPVVAGDKFSAKLSYPGTDGETLSEFEFDVVDRQGSAYEFKG